MRETPNGVGVSSKDGTANYDEMPIALPSDIEDLSDVVEGQKWLIYSDPGIGKTVLLGQLPNVLIVAADPGIVSAARFAGPAQGLRKVWRVNKFPDDFYKVYDYLYENDHPFEWIAIDSVTRIEEKMMRAVMQKRYDANPEKKNADPEAPEQRDYLITQHKIKKFVTEWNALPGNKVWTANVMRTEDQEGDNLVMPLIPGKDYLVSQYVCSEMDVVSYYGLRTIKIKGKEGKIRTSEARRLLLQPANLPSDSGETHYFAKNRYETRKKDGNLLRYVDVCHGDKQLTTFNKVVDHVYNEYTEREVAKNASAS